MLCLLSYVRVLKPPAGVEPAPRPYKGRVLAVDTTEACDGDGGSRTHSSSLQARRSSDRATSPGANGWSRTTTARGTAFTAPGALPVLSVRKNKGGRPDSNRNLEDHDLGCCRYTTTTTRRCRLRRRRLITVVDRNRTPGNHHGPRSGPDFPAESGDDRTRTGACSPDKRVLLPLSYVPLHSAGGIRTHGLELMRLAGTATPLRRDLPGWSRTSDLRRPKPAGWPTPLQAGPSRHPKSALMGRPLAEPDFDPVRYPRRDSNPQLPD